MQLEINIVLNVIQINKRPGAMCHIKGWFMDLIVYFLGMKCALESQSMANFSKQESRERSAGGIETCLDERKGSMNLMNHVALIPRFFKHHSAVLVSFLPFLSLSWLLHFPAKALILFLIHLMPAVATACLLQGLVQIVCSLKQTSAESQHGLLERALARMPESEFRSAWGAAPNLPESHFSHPKSRNNETCPFCRK